MRALVLDMTHGGDLVARRLRRYSHVNGSITLPDFFSKRFAKRKNIGFACRVNSETRARQEGSDRGHVQYFS